MSAAAASLNTVWQKLLALLLAPPTRLKRVMVVPCGDFSVPVRSPTHVWSRPTVADPESVLHALPSMLKDMLLIRPMLPTTAVGDTPVALLSGMANVPVTGTLTTGAGVPTTNVRGITCGEAIPPAYDTVRLNFRTLQHWQVRDPRNFNGTLVGEA